MSDMAKERTRPVTIRLTPDEYDKLKREARDEKLSSHIRRRLATVSRPNSAVYSIESALNTLSQTRAALEQVERKLRNLESDITKGNA